MAVVGLLPSIALAHALPRPKPSGPGGSCPHSYTSSGSFCVPRQGAQHAITLPANGWGPHGWTRSGSLCLCSGSGADSYRDLEHGARHGEVHHIFSVS
jgi:hypothetical protein